MYKKGNYSIKTIYINKLFSILMKTCKVKDKNIIMSFDTEIFFTPKGIVKA